MMFYHHMLHRNSNNIFTALFMYFGYPYHANTEQNESTLTQWKNHLNFFP